MAAALGCRVQPPHHSLVQLLPVHAAQAVAATQTAQAGAAEGSQRPSGHRAAACL